LILIAWWSRGDDQPAVRLISKEDIDKLIALTFARRNDPPAGEAVSPTPASAEGGRYPGPSLHGVEVDLRRDHWQEIYATCRARCNAQFGNTEEKIRW
jgi:hypothetical protein